MEEMADAYKEAYAMHELLRRLGFDVKNDVSLHLDKGKVSVLLLSQNLDFVLEVGEAEDSFEEFKDKWEELSFSLENYYINEDILSSVWKKSNVYNNIDQIIDIIKNIGFKINTDWIKDGC